MGIRSESVGARVTAKVGGEYELITSIVSKGKVMSDRISCSSEWNKTAHLG